MSKPKRDPTKCPDGQPHHWVGVDGEPTVFKCKNCPAKRVFAPWKARAAKAAQGQAGRPRIKEEEAL